MGKRVLVFLTVNFAVIITISIILSMLGVNHYITDQGIDFGSLLIFCSLFGMGGAFVSLYMSKWAAKRMMGVQIIDPNAPGEMGELVHQIHNLAKAARLPKMPDVGIYESPELNAFATGRSRSNSLVAVSTGLLRSMNRDQVEGVLAHEVSHIANGDMVTMTLVQGVVNAFVMFIARIIAFGISQAGSDDEEGMGSSPFMHMMIVIALEMALMPLGMIVVAYFSRGREFRADAGSATLVGSNKMISALEALGRNANSLSAGQDAFASLKIAGRPSRMTKLLSMHPPLEDRIQALKFAGKAPNNKYDSYGNVLRTSQ